MEESFGPLDATRHQSRKSVTFRADVNFAPSARHRQLKAARRCGCKFKGPSFTACSAYSWRMNIVELIAPLFVATLLALGSAVEASNSSDAPIYSHAQCTVPFLDEQPATHYRGTWGPQQFLTSQTLQRVCLYSNVCVQIVQRTDMHTSIDMKSFVPSPPSSEDDASLPPQYLGFEQFTHRDVEIAFDIAHTPVPSDYAWALDAGAPLIYCACFRLSDACPRCALFDRKLRQQQLRPHSD